MHYLLINIVKHDGLLSSGCFVNGKQISDNHEKAQALNEFFLSHSNIDDSHAGLPEEENFANNLDSILATENEVDDILKCINTKKATGPGESSHKPFI